MRVLNVMKGMNFKMKKKKLCITIFFLFFFCGCKIKVDVIVGTKHSMEEITYVSMPREYVEGYFSSLDEARRYYNAILSDQETKREKYSFSLSYKKNVAHGTIKKKRKLKAGAIEGIETMLFKEIKQEKNSFSLIFSENISNYFSSDLEIDVDESALLKEIELNIQFHNVVENNNSDSYDSRTNTYTWIITKDNLMRDIEFTITNEKRYDIIMAYLFKKYIDYILLGALLIVIVIFGVLIVRKSKRENAI